MYKFSVWLIDVCLYACLLACFMLIGYFVGYTNSNQPNDYTNYKDGDICFVRHNGAIIPFACEDSTIESEGNK